MQSLSPEHIATLHTWAAEGATLNDIQARLKTELGIAMTYMETRLLVMDLKLNLRDKKKEEAEAAARAQAEAEAAAMAQQMAAGDSDADWQDADEPEPEVDAPGSHAFDMSVDELMLPGTLVSGKVQFSDGTQAAWFMDQMGRLSLKADSPQYQPPPADIPKFQNGLQAILAKLGV
jgi:hypothetical protein